MLFLIHSFGGGGAERVVAHLASYWAKRRWRVRIVTLSGADSDFYSLDPAIERVGLGSDSVSHSFLLAISNNLDRVAAVRAQLREFQPDVAIGMMTVPNVLLAMASLGARPRVLLGSERVHPPMVGLPYLWLALRRVFYRRFDAVVVLAHESAHWITRHTFVRRVAVIGNPVVLPLPEGRDSEGLRVDPKVASEGRYIFLAVGRLDHQKGFDLLLRAFSAIEGDLPDWDLWILGEGSEREALEGLIDDLQLGSRVHLPGRISNLSDWLSSAHVFVLSSRFEGFPNTLLEAMAHGRPSIAFDCLTGPRVLVNADIDGVLVPVEDVDMLAVAMRRLGCDSDLRRRIGSSARSVVRRYSIDSVAKRWEELFGEGFR